MSASANLIMPILHKVVSPSFISPFLDDRSAANIPVNVGLFEKLDLDENTH